MTLSRDNSISYIAGDTVSSGVEGLALIGDRNTHSLTVEDPVVGALKALLLTPVPKGTTEVRHLLSGSQDAFASIDDVSFVASDAISSKVESGALVGDRDADILTVEDPVVRALKADFICPIPGSASEVGVSFFGGQLAFSSIKNVSFVAAQTVSSGVEGGTLIRNWGADALSILDPIV